MNLLISMLIVGGTYVVALIVMVIVFGFVYMNIGCHYNDPAREEFSMGEAFPLEENTLGAWLNKYRCEIIYFGAAILTLIVSLFCDPPF